MDNYTKVILTAIAVCLFAITIKLWEPTPAYSGFMDKSPTYGDIKKAKKIKVLLPISCRKKPV